MESGKDKTRKANAQMASASKDRLEHTMCEGSVSKALFLEIQDIANSIIESVSVRRLARSPLADGRTEIEFQAH
jgi:hypothetical protein